ncbi:MAG: glycosyltransferase [Sphingobacteriales bacterium]|nr:MAG: glycosyltransferase [Sphingobacteriales bacterium]
MAQKNPLVSVYITNYNYGRYISQSIESLLNQTLQDFELFIIDDGSTDESKKVIEEYSVHPQISIIYQRNKGLNITNNIALRVSRGKYIMRLDADDYLEPDALETMCSTLEADDSLGLVFPDYYLVDANNHLIGEVRRFNFQKEVSLLDQPAHGACTMIRREYLADLGGYDESYSCQDGYELWIKFIAHHKVLNINKPLFYYRQHGSNLTTNESRILETRFQIKNNFINNNNVSTPPTIAVIPVRKTMLKGQSFPLMKVGGMTLLERTVRAAAAAKKVHAVVVTSADEEIKDYYYQHLQGIAPTVMFIERPVEFARINETLNKTLHHILESEAISSLRPEAMMTLAIEYPFLASDMIDDAINTLTIFGADSVLSVRPDNAMYYQHNGNGLQSILDQEKFTRLEREALYKGVGGIVLARIDGFKKEEKMLHGKVGHIVVDERCGLSVTGELSLNMANFLLKNEAPVVQL